MDFTCAKIKGDHLNQCTYTCLYQIINVITPLERDWKEFKTNSLESNLDSLCLPIVGVRLLAERHVSEQQTGSARQL